MFVEDILLHHVWIDGIIRHILVKDVLHDGTIVGNLDEEKDVDSDAAD